MEEKSADKRVIAIALVLAAVLGVFIFAFDAARKPAGVQENSGDTPSVRVQSATPNPEVARAIDLIKANVELSCFRVDRHVEDESKIMSDVMYLTQLEIDPESGKLLVHEKQITTDVDTKSKQVLTFVTSLYSEVMLGSLAPEVEYRENQVVVHCGSTPNCVKTKIEQCMSAGFQSKQECQDKSSLSGVASPNGYDGRENSNNYNLCKQDSAVPVATALGELIAYFSGKPSA